MKSLIALAILSALGLLVNAVIQYRSATGSTMDRLGAAWGGSMTIFVLAWGGFLSLVMQVADVAGQLTGDPDFGKLADQISTFIPAQYHPLIPIATIGAGMVARMRTLGR